MVGHLRSSLENEKHLLSEICNVLRLITKDTMMCSVLSQKNVCIQRDFNIKNLLYPTFCRQELH